MEAGEPDRPISQTLVERLTAICGPDQVILDATTLATYRSDALLRQSLRPALAVLPASAEEVAQVVRACAQAGIPWTARGAGTGLSGGALAVSGGVLIVLTRLRRIISVDIADGIVVAEPGVTNLAISRAVAPSHFYPPDPASQLVCTLGGNVAENAGGLHSLKYGTTTDYVVGLDVVLPDGSLVQLRRDSPGYDLIGAFVGSEGTLGIAVAIHLRVVPMPESVRTLVAFFDTPAVAGAAVAHIIAAGVTPSAMELMDALAMRAVDAAVDAGYRTDAGAALLVELDGPREECAAGLEAVVVHCSRAGAADIRVALDPDEREALWRAQRLALTAMRRVASAYDIGDGVVPRRALSAVLTRISALSAEYGLAVAHVLHAGEGNLHPVICYDRHAADQAARARELADRITELCLAAGGSISGEHGVGVEHREAMSKMFAAADLAAFRTLRSAFDPHGLANPGKLTAPVGV